MADEKVYQLIRIHTTSVKDFSEFWAKVSLPVWKEHGIKHIGSWSYISGGPEDEIVRLFEFKNRKQFEEWQKWLWEGEEGKALRDRLNVYVKLSEGRRNDPVTNPMLLKKVPY